MITINYLKHFCDNFIIKSVVIQDLKFNLIGLIIIIGYRLVYVTVGVVNIYKTVTVFQNVYCSITAHHLNSAVEVGWTCTRIDELIIQVSFVMHLIWNLLLGSWPYHPKWCPIERFHCISIRTSCCWDDIGSGIIGLRPLFARGKFEFLLRDCNSLSFLRRFLNHS